MNDPFANTLDPDAGFAPAPVVIPSISQAANDLRLAAGEKAKEIVHTAEAKAVSLRERAIESAQQFRSTATERAVALKENATERAQQFRETATHQWDDTRDRAKEWHVTAEDYIRQNPSQAVLCAVGVGFLLGLIVRR